MSRKELQRPHGEEAPEGAPGGLDPLQQQETNQPTLALLPIGARLILRCRKDWRDATIVAISLEAITLSVRSPTGRTYRVRRAPDSPLSFDGLIPLLGEGCWRAGMARYDARW